MKKFLLVSLVLLVFAGCGDDDCTTCVGEPSAPEPTLANAWPNEDGRGWTYDFLAREWPDTTLPPNETYTIDDVDSVLAVSAPLDATTEAHIWRQVFEGEYTTDSGVTGQNLRGYYFRDVEVGVPRWVPDEVLPREQRLVWPERMTMEEFAARRICCVGGLLLEGGPAFVKTEEHIATYGELDTELSWKWLEADLSPGASFVLQLIPALANDVFLHGEIQQVHDLSTPYGDFENALSVNYMIDQGEVEILGTGGESVEVFHPYTFGRMEFVPGVGPVYTFERSIFPGGEVTQDLGTGGPMVFEYEYWLIGTGIAEQE